MLARITLATLILAFASLSWAGLTFPTYEHTEFSLAANNSSPFGITAGPDGAMWFTDQLQTAIGRITVDGSTRFFRLTDLSSQPTFITAGSDGNLWFTDPDRSMIGRMTPLGEPDEFPLPGLEDPLVIVAGPDGNLWFSVGLFARGLEGGQVGRITPSGTVSLFPIDTPSFYITNGPDRALWFTSFTAIGRITTGGQTRFFEVGGQPQAITTGPDGALWFTSAGCLVPAARATASGDGLPCDYGIGRLTPDGVLTPFADVSPTSMPSIIVRGPEDNLWFTRGDGRISRINLAGRVDDIVTLTGGAATDIAVGPDGAVWLAEPHAHSIGRVSSLAYDFINIANGAPVGLAEAPDGSIWFADAGGNRVGRIGTDGSLIQHELGGGHTPNAIAGDPDGSAWFANSEANTIGHITVDDEVVEFVISPPNATPQDIVRGPDGNFWFTLATSSIGRITPQGVIKTFSTPSAAASPQGIAVGADGNLWFTETAANRIGRMTTSGASVDFLVPTTASEPWDIAAGPDGALYFTELRGGRVGRITTDGGIAELGTASPSSSPRYIALGPDGAMWFSVIASRNNVAASAAEAPPRVQIADDPTATPTATPTAGQAGLGRIARDGRITTFRLPVSEENPAGIAGSRSGRLFVALFDLSQIANIELVAAEPTQTATPTTENTAIATATRTGSAPCPGDCNGDQQVLISELIAAVNIALGSPVATCPAADINGDGTVLVNELITAVSRALRGC